MIYLENVYEAATTAEDVTGGGDVWIRYVYPSEPALQYLYQLLAEREPHMNISHKTMPTPEEHERFVRSDPYKAWYLITRVEDETLHDAIERPAEYVGAIYLTHNNEIGLQIERNYQGYGHGTDALDLLMDRHEGPFLANINPLNSDSIKFFRKHGFKLIQETYKLEVESNESNTTCDNCTGCTKH